MESRQLKGIFHNGGYVRNSELQTSANHLNWLGHVIFENNRDWYHATVCGLACCFFNSPNGKSADLAVWPSRELIISGMFLHQSFT